MSLENYVDLLPEDKRDEFKSEVSKFVNLDEVLASPDKAATLLDKEYFKKQIQSISDRKAAEQEKKFMAERLPVLLEEERKKGEKSPLELKIEELEARDAERTKALLRAEQKSRAIEKLQAAKLPLAFVDRYVGTTDEETDEQLTPIIATLTKFRDDAVTEALKEFGVQRPPQAGSDGKSMPMTEFRKLSAIEQSKYMSSGGKITE
jgi:hypothetical protein